MSAFTTISELTGVIIKILIEIHNKYGGACFESFYEEILYYELSNLGIKAQRQVILPILHKELLVRKAYKVDMLIEDRLVVELKSVFPLPPVYFKQVATQLTLTKLKHGMLVNFKVARMVDGIHRIFNNKGNEFLNK